MSRHRVYASGAERQRAYRLRQKSGGRPPDLPPPALRKPRELSRPARLRGVEEALRDLQREYEDWLESLPESLEDSNTADLLRETIENLETAAETVANIQPPRGYGRD